ncbi:MAG: GNAT family N-acetyltransferase, partial [Comamonadaceae bacterium]
ADKRWRVDEVADPGWFRRLYADHLARSGRESYFDLHHIDTLYEAARQRGQAAIRRSVDDAGQVAAAVFTVWDQHRAWYLMSTRDPAVSDNGAVSQLLWHCIRDAAARGLVFDFDGISSPGTARFYAGFGATMGPRYSVSRASTGYQLAMAARDWVRGRPARNAFTAP